MTKRIKIFAILTCVILLVGLGCSVGVTAAIWTSGAGAGDSSFDATIEPFDWNIWAKYFNGVKLASGEARLTGFNDIVFNGYILTIPMNIVVEGEKESRIVAEIASGIFVNSVLKEMVEEIYIPHTVKRICANAFSGFANLKKIVFEDIEGSGEVCKVEMFAFSGCGDFDPATGVVTGNRKIEFAPDAFFPKSFPNAV